MKDKTRGDIYNKFETLGDIYYLLKNPLTEYEDDKFMFYFFKR